MTNKQHIKLALLFVWRYFFFAVTFIIQIILIILEILIMLLGKGAGRDVDPKWSNAYSDWCIKCHKNILTKEFKIIFKHEDKK